MDFQSKSGNELRFKGSREILNEIGKVWNTVEKIEKAAEEILEEGNPILESLEFAWVHIMNAYQEIEGDLTPNTGNRLEPKTLAQIIDVLTRIKWTGTKYRNGLIEAYQSAVSEVGNFNGIHRNTIADACTRRLQINRNGFLDLAESWLKGDSRSLKQILKAHCNITEHTLIDDFFHKKGGFRENYRARPKTD
jgi:hypothetical protein